MVGRDHAWRRVDAEPDQRAVPGHAVLGEGGRAAKAHLVSAEQAGRAVDGGNADDLGGQHPLAGHGVVNDQIRPPEAGILHHRVMVAGQEPGALIAEAGVMLVRVVVAGARDRLAGHRVQQPGRAPSAPFHLVLVPPGTIGEPLAELELQRDWARQETVPAIVAMVLTDRLRKE